MLEWHSCQICHLLEIIIICLSKTDNIRFVHNRIWRQIDITGYLNGSTSSKFVSAPFKSFTFSSECISL